MPHQQSLLDQQHVTTKHTFEVRFGITVPQPSHLSRLPHHLQLTEGMMKPRAAASSTCSPAGTPRTQKLVLACGYARICRPPSSVIVICYFKRTMQVDNGTNFVLSIFQGQGCASTQRSVRTPTNFWQCTWMEEMGGARLIGKNSRPSISFEIVLCWPLAGAQEIAAQAASASSAWSRRNLMSAVL